MNKFARLLSAEMSADYDNLFLSIAQGSEDGIRGLLDAFFGFLSRRTDFYYGATQKDCKEIVLEAFKKHRVGSFFLFSSLCDHVDLFSFIYLRIGCITSFYRLTE